MKLSTCNRCAINRHCPISWTMAIMTGLEWDCPFFEDLGVVYDFRSAERAIKEYRKHRRTKAK